MTTECDPYESTDYKTGYADGYEETRRQHGNDVDLPIGYPDSQKEGFKAGCRAAKNDMGDGTMSDEAFGCGCVWAAMVFVLFMLGLSFEQSFFTGLGCGLAIMYIIYDCKRCK